MKISHRLLVAAGALLLSGASSAQGHHYTLLHHFTGGATDGGSPQGSLTLTGTTFYGMTLAGGPANAGTIFRINTDGTGFALVHAFDGSGADGGSPYGSLTLDNTVLYGMTSAGGSYGLGTVFKINTDGTGFTILHSFAGGTVDGGQPYGSLTLSGSTLYGMTFAGGSYGLGTVFRMNTDGTGFAVLHAFAGYDPNRDGANPYGSLILAGSTLYGMTSTGGSNPDVGTPFYHVGTVFQINADGTGYLILHSFHGGGFEAIDGANPRGSLTISGSSLYGMTVNGSDDSFSGMNFGTIFRQDITGTGFTELLAFGQRFYSPSSVTYGLNPYGSLTLSGSTLYGMTSAGGGGSRGLVFQINTDGTGGVVLHTFDALDDGRTPYGDLTLSGSTLYGMTSAGGYGLGVLFALTPNAPLVGAPPSSQSVAAGGSATFSVAATGVAPLSYQWQRQAFGSSTWSNLTDVGAYSGTATATLTVGSLTTAMSGDLFRCVISNAYGDDTSTAAALVVPVPMTVSTFAGQGGIAGGSDGTGSSAQFNGPADVAVDSGGNVYVADTYNHTIRKITPAGAVSTVAGYTGASGSVDGSAAAARFNHPSGVTVDSAGNIFVADTDNQTIRKITPPGAVTTLAGQAAASGSADGTGSAARFNGPSGLAVDSNGNIYVADTLNHTLRKITPAGVVTTFAGRAGTAGAADGTGTAAQFFGLQGLALDGGGNLYVADTNACTIRKVVLGSGVVTTLAGASSNAGTIDAPGSMARFWHPAALAADGAGNLFVTDTDGNTIREISASGVVSTIAGLAGTIGSADGVGTAVRFHYPGGLALDGAGNLYIADTSNQTIRLGYFAAGPLITTQPQSQTVTAGTNVQFSVTCTGRPAPTLQWYCTGAAISGATGSALNLPAVQSINAGDYTVTATNASGSVTSNRATLTVNAVPSVSTATAGGGGGGGAMELWFVLGLLGLAGGRRMAADFRR